MLIPAVAFPGDLHLESALVIYNPDYQFYFLGGGYNPVTLSDDNYVKQFVSMESKEKERTFGSCYGFISYRIDPTTNSISDISAISFERFKMDFMFDLRECVKNMFYIDGAERIEFRAIPDNPASKVYDKVVAKLGGQKLCTRHKCVRLNDGKIYDESIYEIMRENLNWKYLDKFGI